ncbi:PaaI family thioesterase [Alloalcanivorax xenomutans]|uniref:PaaI family thioesterase n=1 Tax=Alloalcanivorax xenomutans TaxID=1094342 RepID=A0A9Q3ZBF8_9GAMM|nr:PaaI family thioesterase [Alloalcanivorax xenomutans]ERS15069.1 hypothetical protein Q668_07670 [Alcanivorax sp. PN-3]MCE7507583.1 PaaI family thioesterase [Alloalcanivorax xenomutans]MCE7524727.1 PaaI family thioesterase [Alloalcanivorax xenomutans]WOA32996.1 PaaI family thioesterase [Alloalcanivorax xenomutans]WOD29957.1 PaaI family thioesterase [Alloalcanivorax xenomutans]
MSSSLTPDAVPALNQAAEKFKHGFLGTIGFHFLEWEEDRVVLGLNVVEKHLNLGNVIHGGVLATLLDVSGACSGTYCPYPGRVRKALTLSLTTTFTGQAGPGLVRAIGVKRAGGNRIFNSSMEVLDANDRLLAFGEGTFRLRGGSEDPKGVVVDY